jgi:general secretion pathway protein G
MFGAHRNSMNRRDKDGGYTLTEMLVVIGIISLIAAVLTPGLLNHLSRARAKAAELQLKSVAASVEQFREDVGRYPTAQEGLSVLLKAPAGAENWTGPYAESANAITDPWGRPVLYIVDDKNHRFHVETLGADGAPGGTSFNRDLRYPADQ